MTPKKPMTKDEAEKCLPMFEQVGLAATVIVNPFDNSEWLVAVNTVPTGVRIIHTPLQAEWFLAGYVSVKRARL